MVKFVLNVNLGQVFKSRCEECVCMLFNTLTTTINGKLKVEYSALTTLRFSSVIYQTAFIDFNTKDQRIWSTSQFILTSRYL
jgi:hypothetical protein